MRAYLLGRLWQMVPTLLGVMVLIFVLFNWVGGDPSQVLAGKISDPKQIESIRHELGVDRPYIEQFGVFVRQVVTGDFGRSWSTKEEVSHIIATRIGPTLTIMVPLLILETVIGVVLAMVVAYRRGTLTDRAIMIICTVGMSVSFLAYIIGGQYLLAFLAGWFPVQGWSNSFTKNLATYAPLPIFLALLVGLAPTVRLYRTVFLEEMHLDYVRTARAKGIAEHAVLLRHVLPNALIPIITNVAMTLPTLMVGSFLLEKFFSIPGLGREIINAVDRSDFPVIKAVTVYLALATMIFNLLADLLYRWADPRVQFN